MKPKNHMQKRLIFGKYCVMFRTVGVALEHKAALMGMPVHPATRSDTESDSMNHAVRSSRSSANLTSSAIRMEFMTMFRTITQLITTGFTSLNSCPYMPACSGVSVTRIAKCVYLDLEQDSEWSVRCKYTPVHLSC